jgi:hypothetical protein
VVAGLRVGGGTVRVGGAVPGAGAGRGGGGGAGGGGGRALLAAAGEDERGDEGEGDAKSVHR